MENYVNWHEKNVQDKKKLNSTQNSLYKIIISYIFICIKMQPGLILESLYELP